MAHILTHQRIIHGGIERTSISKRQAWICKVSICTTSNTHCSQKLSGSLSMTSNQILAQLQQPPKNNGLMCYNYNSKSLCVREKQRRREALRYHRDSTSRHCTWLKITLCDSNFWTSPGPNLPCQAPHSPDGIQCKMQKQRTHSVLQYVFAPSAVEHTYVEQQWQVRKITLVNISYTSNSGE